MATGATHRALDTRGSLPIRGDGCPIVTAAGCLSTGAAGAGPQADGTDGIAVRGWRMRLRDFMLLALPLTAELWAEHLGR